MTSTEMMPSAATQAELFLVLQRRRSHFRNFIARRVPTGVDPDDVLQEAMLLAARGIASLRDEERLVPWFYRIVRRVTADSSARTRRLEPAADRDTAAVVDEFPCDCAVALLEGLPNGYADVLRRAYLQAEAPTEIARDLGTTLNNLSVRLHRARQALRDRLQERCGTTSARTCVDCCC